MLGQKKNKRPIDKQKRLMVYCGLVAAIAIVIILLGKGVIGGSSANKANATTVAGSTQNLIASVAGETNPAIDEDGSYYSKDEVALYIHTYGHLPKNFVTKSDAEAAGWSGGSVEKYFPGGAIGGDVFKNYEKLLPTGKTYYECDIDTLGKDSRGAKRIIFSDDGYIYYTEDHYNTFETLYEGK